MPVYGFRDKETADKLRLMAEGNQTLATGSALPLKPSIGYKIKNEDSKAIPPYGIAFAKPTRYEAEIDENKNIIIPVGAHTGTSGLTDFSNWFINGIDEIPPDKIGNSIGVRDVYPIAVKGAVNVGEKYGLGLGVSVGKWKLEERESDLLQFRCMSKISNTLDYALFKPLPPEPPDSLLLGFGYVESLGDFPDGRNNSSFFYGTTPGTVMVHWNVLSGPTQGPVPNPLKAYYFGPFPLAVGADVVCLFTNVGNVSPGSSSAVWWIIDMQRFELPASPLGG